MPMCTMRGETEGLIHETVRLAMAFFFCPEKAKTSLVLIDKRGFVLVDGTGLEHLNILQIQNFFGSNSRLFWGNFWISKTSISAKIHFLIFFVFFSCISN